MNFCALRLNTKHIIPVGTIQPHMHKGGIKDIKLPRGWLLCDGRQVSMEDYAELSYVLNIMFKPRDSADEYGKFYLPNMKKKYLRFSDGLSETTGTELTSENPLHSHTGTAGVSGAHSHMYDTYGVNYTVNGAGSTGFFSLGHEWGKDNPSSGEHTHDVIAIESGDGDVFAPESYPAYYIIKY